MVLPLHHWFPPMEPKKPRSPRAGLLLVNPGDYLGLGAAATSLIVVWWDEN